MTKNLCLITVCLLVSLLYACSATLYKPTLQTSGSPERLKELSQGRALYVSKCSSCHNLHKPEEYTASQWQENLNEMQKRAKITDEQKKLIQNYLVPN